MKKLFQNLFQMGEVAIPEPDVTLSLIDATPNNFRFLGDLADYIAGVWVLAYGNALLGKQVQVITNCPSGLFFDTLVQLRVEHHQNITLVFERKALVATFNAEGNV